MRIPNFKTGDKLYEYLLIINPDNYTVSISIDIKKSFEMDYDCRFAKSLPHITLSNFILYECMEKKVLKQLKQAANYIAPSFIEINGFDHFSNHTIFLNVNAGNAIQRLTQHLRKFRRHMTAVKDLKPHYCTKLHLTIARGMRIQQFNDAWPVWQCKQVNSSFVAKKMILLKREFTYSTTYTKCSEFAFTGSNSDSIQLNLDF